MDKFFRNRDLLEKYDSFAGAPVYRAKHRCKTCDRPIKPEYGRGPGGECYFCGYKGEDLDPVDNAICFGLYFRKKDWGDAEGKVIYDLKKFAREIQSAKDQEKTEKMANILALSIIKEGFDSYDRIVIPPSSSSGPNHMHPKAEQISKRFGIPFEKSVEKRSKTGQMKGKGAKARKKAAEDNYKCNVELNNDRVLILDDILTTGSTVKGVAQAIHAQGASQIAVVSMARNVDLDTLTMTKLITDD